MALNMPSINVYITQLASTAVARSANGKLAVVVIDDTEGGNQVVKCTTINDLEKDNYTAANYNDVGMAFLGSPAEVTVIKMATTADFADDIVPLLNQQKFDWITVLTDTAETHTALAAYVEAYNAKPVRKAIKGMVYQATAPDDKHIVNFTTETFNTVSAQDQEGWHLLARIAGTLAGLPMTQTVISCTFPEIESVSEPEDMDAEVEKGHLFLYNDDDGVAISRGVNSMTTLSGDDTEDMRSIAIVEAMDLIKYDIGVAFKKFRGTYKNSYDRQALFITAVLAYFTQLAEETILDPNYDNTADVDVKAQRAAWVAAGRTEAAEWDDVTTKMMTFKRKMFLHGNIKILDGIEDLDFHIEMV